MYLLFHYNFSENKNIREVYRPMLSVTVMMFKDIVESVTLLKEDA